MHPHHSHSYRSRSVKLSTTRSRHLRHLTSAFDLYRSRSPRVTYTRWPRSTSRDFVPSQEVTGLHGISLPSPRAPCPRGSSRDFTGSQVLTHTSPEDEGNTRAATPSRGSFHIGPDRRDIYRGADRGGSHDLPRHQTCPTSSREFAPSGSGSEFTGIPGTSMHAHDKREEAEASPLRVHRPTGGRYRPGTLPPGGNPRNPRTRGRYRL